MAAGACMRPAARERNSRRRVMEPPNVAEYTSARVALITLRLPAAVPSELTWRTVPRDFSSNSWRSASSALDGNHLVISIGQDDGQLGRRRGEAWNRA